MQNRTVPTTVELLAAVALSLVPACLNAGSPTFSDANWSTVGGASGANDWVEGAAVDSTGNLYIGGPFTAVDGTVVNGIAKWDGKGWSALGSGMDGYITALAVAGNDLYAAGGFTTAGGSAASNIAKWDGNSWSALGSGLDDEVDALAVSGSDLYAGGIFTTAGGSAAK
jgi:hypothetical protein